MARIIRPSTASRAFWRRVTQRVARYTPEVRAALISGYTRLLTTLSEAQVATFLEHGGVEHLIANALDDKVLAEAFRPLRATVNDGLRQSTTYHARDLPAIVPREVAASFNVLSPHVIEAIRTLDTRVLSSLSKSVRDTVREHVATGLQEGLGSRAIARGMREVIPLAPNQSEAVRNFRRALLRDPGAANPLDYKLRDHRFDRTIRNALSGEAPGLTKGQVSTYVDAYRRHMVAFNAQTNANTTALDTFKEGQHLAWDNAVEAGLVAQEDLTKTWRGVLDDREREEHLAMEGETVSADEPYSNGQMEPGDDEYNCRCLSQYGLRGAA